MTDVLCAHCQAVVIEGMPICPACGGDPSMSPRPVNPTVTEPPPGPAVPLLDGPEEVVCSGCGHPNRIRERPYCERCLTPLEVSLASHQASTPARKQLGCLRLVLMSGAEVELCPGNQVMLGRDRLQSPVGAELADFDAVSRRHATVGRSSTGAVWVRDEASTNGTFVNGRPVPASATLPLRPGDVLRLGASVTARLEEG